MIVGSQKLKAALSHDVESLFVAEQFLSLQGEGPTRGVPAVFLRLAGCTLACRWCDTTSVWMNGQPRSKEALVEDWRARGWLARLSAGAHLVVTGGSPLLQEARLFPFLMALPPGFFEMETEGVLIPDKPMDLLFRQYNVSPKLANSGMPMERRYVVRNLHWYAASAKSVFKFVVETPEDVDEVQRDFVGPLAIDPRRVWLMPQASTREQLAEKSAAVAGSCIDRNFNFSSRDQVAIWDKTTGV